MRSIAEDIGAYDRYALAIREHGTKPVCDHAPASRSAVRLIDRRRAAGRATPASEGCWDFRFAWPAGAPAQTRTDAAVLPRERAATTCYRVRRAKMLTRRNEPRARHILPYHRAGRRAAGCGR
jgi:hypothetical protein